ncbi:N-acetyl-beta-glucosaminyl-glycoprotein 4-beta-N-acetylgalactosaminyltransferase 1 [Electrophorus electricus]|uniref:N-acetyl-beta-glucosaminyl-glycoprotein 4-beta-N-acetylgalactosaminyltransferase 1 n=1 Tax=Electrophorus electricus TaxID=8005 RepID=UPI0015CFF95B|nr:N-acetyl-beta-glucosaminyl-glycoprotein 4-beta-N-acetylgalactosaminyltransferase 1 [Electrophorus electricus]XP_026869598.2 N-acetyl-beta-glucosaminyl-glycoprotein 4-beta-N-acetylgalactosaminyltransferase 1 [Electrophorus electricus]
MRFPLKKIRKQFKLLLLLVLLTFAVGFTYLHVNQGKAIKLHLSYGKDPERQTEGLGSSHKKHSHSSSHADREESNDSGEETRGGNELSEFGQESHGNTEIRQLLSQKLLKLLWKPEYKGQANLHVFEDWCGSSVSQLRKNLHFPLYPHARTTIKKLAVAPKWKNYGLRIFGFIHPYKDGDFQFAIASDDNSELWLSSDENPLNARLLVYVGRHGSEWTAPGEFTKFRSQTSKSVHLMSCRRYYFEILHKQDDKGSDHVEVGWRPFLPGLKYDVIDSAYISLYTDESGLKMSSVAHVPQTLASHTSTVQETPGPETPAADMLKPDARDTFYKIPMIDRSRVEKVLPSCLYSPTYIVKDFPIARYQGLQFVYLPYVYPNDFTRLTHMEGENKCFYRESPVYLEKFGFYKYMKMDEEKDDGPVFFPNPDDFLEEEEGADPEEDSVNSNSHPIRKTRNSSLTHQLSRSWFSTASTRINRLRWDSKGHAPSQEGPSIQLRRKRPGRKPKQEYRGREDGSNMSTQAKAQEKEEIKKRKVKPLRFSNATGTQHGAVNKNRKSKEEEDDPQMIHSHGRSLMWTALSPVHHGNNVIPLRMGKTPKISHQSPLHALANHILGNVVHPASHVLEINQEKEIKMNKMYITRHHPPKSKPREMPRPPVEVFPGVFLYQTGRGKKLVDLSSRSKSVKRHSMTPLFWASYPLATHELPTQQISLKRSYPLLTTRQEPKVSPSHSFKISHSASISDPISPSPQSQDETDPLGANVSENNLPVATGTTKASGAAEDESLQMRAAEPEEGGASEYSYEETEPQPGWAEEAIDWQRTFTVNPVDFELLRSDWNDLRCNVSGNLQLPENEAVDVLSQYIDKLNEHNGGIYTLLRIVNVEKRRDSARGSRYLVELELMEEGKRVVRLSEYVYLLLHHSRLDNSMGSREGATAFAPPVPSRALTRGISSTQPRAPTPFRSPWAKPLLCQPAMLQWRPDVMVHFVVPVKNQARWVQQFIADMEVLHRETRDENFSVIIVDFESDDMDVEQALRESMVPRYEYLRREGNFERSSGLQMGVDAIEDSHSIVFLCDLHIHFPLSILESIRKHCVAGKLAFAPIVMRLDCGSSPLQPNGYWEVNGFGLFGIYKSDFDKIGGMNTEEFKDRWGGEDWEFLDRVLQNGLEVERLRLRNFYHFYHSKRGMWNSPIKKPTQG